MLLTHRSRASGVRWWPHRDLATSFRSAAAQARDRSRQAQARVEIEGASGRAGTVRESGAPLAKAGKNKSALPWRFWFAAGMSSDVRRSSRAHNQALNVSRTGMTRTRAAHHPQHAATLAPTFCGVTLTFKCLNAVAPPAMPRMIPLLMMTMCKKTSRAQHSTQTRLSDGPPDCGTSFRYTSKVATR
jgi:hypothetical protein